jgi:CMP-2-keto-3-deoxyoctulosonic acid synthetase
MKWDSDLNEYSLFRQVNVLYNFGYYFASHEIHSNEVIGVDDDEKLEIARKVYEKIKTK